VVVGAGVLVGVVVVGVGALLDVVVVGCWPEVLVVPLPVVVVLGALVGEVVVVALLDGVVPGGELSAAATPAQEPETAANVTPAARTAAPRRIRCRNARRGSGATTPATLRRVPGAGNAIGTRSGASRLNSA
jgi:hypothetical protein